MSSTSTVNLDTLQAQATAFKALHVPGKPLILANVYDATSARIVASLPGCRALASASYALAKSIGIEDEQLTMDQNMALVAPIAEVARHFGLPLTIDIQDGYGDSLEEVVRRAVVEVGAVGVNLEDSYRETGKMTAEDEAVDRVARALKAAKNLGVDDFVVNARSDSFLMGGSIDESIRRGKLYLEAGATTVYVFWPPSVEMLEADVKKVIDGLDGKANIQTRKVSAVQKKELSSADVARLGAARISVGPQLYLAMAEAIKVKANSIFGC